MKTEHWGTISGTDGIYCVSDFGKVRNNKTGRILIPQESHHGYLRVDISVNGKRKNFYVHRLVADAFLPNPNNFPQINHKDENKKNNSVWNLEWCTGTYNCSYGNRTMRIREKIGNKVKKYTSQGKYICECSSINEAAKSVSGEWHGLRNACGTKREYHGFVWELG